MLTACVLYEAGYSQALYGMSLSFNAPLENMPARADHNAHLQGGHNKFLESIMLWIEVRAPRYWWQEADTYRISSKQSESTMHTVMKRELTQQDFIEPIPDELLTMLNDAIRIKDFIRVKRLLPESFMQRRVWCMSYKTLQNIYMQRRNHKLVEWHDFLDTIIAQLQHPEFILQESE